MKKIFLSGLSLISLASISFADEVRCKDGSVYLGEIEKIENDFVFLKNEKNTDDALKIKQSNISFLETKEQIFVRDSKNNTLNGRLKKGTQDGVLLLNNGVSDVPVNLSDLSILWTDPSKSPEAIEAEKNKTRWEFEAEGNLLGKTGNTESISTGLGATALRKSVVSSLKLYAKYNYGKTKDDLNQWSKSADDLHVGFDWTLDCYKRLALYVRSDNGFDRVKNIRFFSTDAVGPAVHIIKEDDWNLKVRAGLSYRYESYKDYMGTLNGIIPDDTNSLGLDFGISHDKTWSWGKLVNEITYTPTFEHFKEDYVIYHESYLQFKVDNWDALSFKIGVSNEYRSLTTAKEHLDTTYFARIAYSWK